MGVAKAVLSSLGLLTPRDRRLLAVSVLLQMSTALLDLVGVLLIGLVGALAVTTVQSQPPPELVERLVSQFGLSRLPQQELVLLIAAIAAVVLLSKSLISTYLARRVLRFLANRQALVSARLAEQLLAKPLTFVQQRASQETAFALIGGAGAATLGILGFTVIGLSELALLLVMGIALLVISPWVALGAIIFFGVLAALLQRVLGKWATRTGSALATTEIESLKAVQEALGAYREISVSGRRALYVERIQELRWQAAQVSADWQFLNMMPKYIFEAALVVGGFALAAVLFATQDAVVAVSTLAVFLAAGSRIMPSLLRLQNAALGLRGVAATAAPTFALAESLAATSPDSLDGPLPLSANSPVPVADDFMPTVRVSNMYFTHAESKDPTLNDISFEAKAGTSVAIIGRSGAGKSTLADIVLGVLEADSGTVSIGGMSPSECIARWPGAVAYVPQDVLIASATVRANVALGLPEPLIDDSLVWAALERAHLAEFLRDQREGLGTMVGENGLRLSGGQRQRLGLARALYTKPRLIVLDEATSALDTETERSISQTIDELEGDVTTLIIAHRLSTVRECDLVLYLDHGKVVGRGSFDEVARQVPALERQVNLIARPQDT